MRPLMATLSVAALCAFSACDEQKAAAPSGAETASLPDSPTPYKVLSDTMTNGTVDFHILVAEGTKHDEVQKLLEYLYRHLTTRHEDPPAGMGGFVYNAEAAYATPPRTPIGSIVKKPSDLAPTFTNIVPLEFSQEVEQALGDRGDKAWKLKLEVARDDATHTVSLTVPYTDMGKDQWAETLSFNQAMQEFTDLAQQLFGKVAELRALNYDGKWKGESVLKIAITRADYNALKLAEIDERIGAHHGRIFLQAQLGKEAQMSPEKANASLSKQNAAIIGKEYRSLISQLKGKATVAASLK